MPAMARTRKRKRSGREVAGKLKRQKIIEEHSVIKQAVLAQFYSEVVTLRDYILIKLPTTSKVRRKKVLSVGTRNREEDKLGTFLDQTMIGISKSKVVSKEERTKQWTTFTQKADDSHDATSFMNTMSTARYSQAEVVDFAIWLLFSKSHTLSARNQHLLCQGYKKKAAFHFMNHEGAGTSAIPGVVSTYPNSNVTEMKGSPWPQVLALLGRDGEAAMIDLIIDCGIFLALNSSQGIYYQLSGFPLGDLEVLPSKIQSKSIAHQANAPNAPRTSSKIRFIKNRMMYGRPALNAEGNIRFGVGRIHFLNRFPICKECDDSNEKSIEKSDPDTNTRRVLMYIFPRQFGLHNVFNSDVNPLRTAQPYKDYNFREDEICQKYPTSAKVKIPKRLREKTVELVRKLQIRHKRCQYKKLLDYYCPVESSQQGYMSDASSMTMASTTLKTQINSIPALSGPNPGPVTKTPPCKFSMINHATPTAMVSAFCRSVMFHVIPHQFWGSGKNQILNEKVFYRNVHRFIELRRFESFSLHEVVQGLRIADIEWLCPPGFTTQKSCQSDTSKRWEIFFEFVYFLFDAILIPLIRSNFYVTESNAHRNRLFYFRHDIWRTLSEPALASLKCTMLEEVKLKKATQILESRSLGFSRVRLLPKDKGVRPIMNLRRRPLKKGYQDILGSSINSILAPIHHILTLEKKSNPSLLGGTLFSVSDLYPKLKRFKSVMLGNAKPFYFCKVDVQAAFDTIPQSAVLDLIANVFTEENYRISRHAEIRPRDNHQTDPNPNIMRKWTALAHFPDDFDNFSETISNSLKTFKKETIFVENVVNYFRSRSDILALLKEHIQNNMIKIGKRFYRQKKGIPQGSVLSSLLCSYFYADLESRHLSFLDPCESLLVRLIDDFLLITTNTSHAKEFLQIMHDGLPAYGVAVNPNKSLVNFEVSINHKKVPQVLGNVGFPYCGNLIDIKTLDISKNRTGVKDLAVRDSLTVEFSRVPGKTFQRKVLNTFKIQSHAIFFSTNLNSLNTVLRNIHSAFVESATKSHVYISCLSVKNQPGPHLLLRTLQELISLAWVLVCSRQKDVGKRDGGRPWVSQVMVEWLALKAFQVVLARKQSKYRAVLSWLEERITLLQLKEPGTCERMIRVVGPDR